MQKNNISIAIGADHAGFRLKEKVITWLEDKNIKLKDYGTYEETPIDYVDIATLVAKDISERKHDFGILICKTGIGMSMSANKFKNIRAGLAWNQEIGRLAKAHNNANIICLPGAYLNTVDALKTIETFLNEVFESGRHQQRVEKLNEL